MNKLVPVEPTEAMIAAFHKEAIRYATRDGDLARRFQGYARELEALKASPPSGGAAVATVGDECTSYPDGHIHIVHTKTKLEVGTKLYTSPRVVDEAMKVAQQALMEVAHAQSAGPQWYSRGESGLRAQVDMWVRKGLTALQAALGEGK